MEPLSTSGMAHLFVLESMVEIMRGKVFLIIISSK